jgi:uncharacterized membrane protein
MGAFRHFNGVICILLAILGFLGIAVFEIVGIVLAAGIRSVDGPWFPVWFLWTVYALGDAVAAGILLSIGTLLRDYDKKRAYDKALSFETARAVVEETLKAQKESENRFKKSSEN